MSNQSLPTRVLRIDASARQETSITRTLADELIARLTEHHGELELRQRNVSTGLDFVDEPWIGANYTDPAQRDSAQQQRLHLSDQLVDEVVAADVLVIGVPVYNFGIPASLKAWIDQVARVGRTFRYTENGPVGLLKGRKAYLVFASGGVAVDSEADFASSYMRHVLRFLGITDVQIIAAEGVAINADDALQTAREQIANLDPRLDHAA